MKIKSPTKAKPRKRDTNWMLNRYQVRKYTLACAAQKKMGDGKTRFTRVGSAYMQMLDTAVRVLIQKHCETLGSRGRTVR